MKQILIDPPSGWMYGFPKVLPEGTENVTEWLISEGYPKELIDQFNGHVPCTITEINDAD